MNDNPNKSPAGEPPKKELCQPIDSERIDEVVNELREMASAGADVPTLLRRIQRSLGLNDCKIIAVKCFRKAFGGRLKGVTPVAGWSGFGGELSDARVESLVSPAVNAFRQRLEKGRDGSGTRK